MHVTIIKIIKYHLIEIFSFRKGCSRRSLLVLLHEAAEKSENAIN